MSWEAVAWAKQQRGLGTSGKLLLLLMAERADGWRCWPAIKTLAEEMECHTRTVQRLIADLVEAGLIRRYPRWRANGSRTSDLFVLVGGGDNLTPHPSDETAYVEPPGDSPVTPPGDMQAVTPPVTRRVSPPEHQKNTNTSGGAELALADTDGSLFLVKAEAVEITAQAVVAAWVDEIRKNDVEPSKAQIGRVARMAKELLEKNRGDRVLDAARHAGAHGNAAIDSALTILNGKPFRPPQKEKRSSVVTTTSGRIMER